VLISTELCQHSTFAIHSDGLLCPYVCSTSTVLFWPTLELRWLWLLQSGTDDWRYTEWTWWDGTNLVGNFSREPVGVELYPHKGDTEADFDM
jgi:hypothetical protein